MIDMCLSADNSLSCRFAASGVQLSENPSLRKSIEWGLRTTSEKNFFFDESSFKKAKETLKGDGSP